MKITKQTAKKLYPKVEDWFKKELEEAFGMNIFVKKSFEEIKTFEHACEELDINSGAVFIGAGFDTPDEIAYKKLKIIIKAINQGWAPDWSNTNQRKWWPYFNLSSGFGFSSTTYYYDRTDAFVGSRLCFESEEKAIYAGKQFLQLYKEFLT